MAISVKDIHEKEFSKTYRGYTAEEVDDFLDALAEQMEELIRENHMLRTGMEEAKQAAANAKAEAEAAEAKAQAAGQMQPVAAFETPVVVEDKRADEVTGLPAINEPSYFKNLETTLRETLISAQRIADETIDEARKKARKIVAEAEEQSETIENQSNAKMAQAKADYDALRNAAEDYRTHFSALIEGQAKLLKDTPIFH